MKIKTLIEQELADTHTHQARWQALVKQIILEEGPANKERIMTRVKAEAERIGGRLVRRSVGLGMQWLAEGRR
jgi:ferritin-like metal-binding protein YciE